MQKHRSSAHRDAERTACVSGAPFRTASSLELEIVTMNRIGRIAAAAFAAATLSTASQAAPVSLELYLAADVSGSIDGTDFNLHRQGLATAFQSVAVKNTIALSGTGIAVTLVDFANSPVTAVDWPFITNAAQADAFAAAILDVFAFLVFLIVAHGITLVCAAQSRAAIEMPVSPYDHIAFHVPRVPGWLLSPYSKSRATCHGRSPPIQWESSPLDPWPCRS